MSKRVSLVLPDEVYDEIEKRRGIFTRNSYVVRLLQDALKEAGRRNNTPSARHLHGIVQGVNPARCYRFTFFFLSSIYSLYSTDS